MKKAIIIFFLLSSSLLSFSQSSSEKAVASAVENLRKAMVDGDSLMLDKLTLEKLSYGHSGGHIDTKSEFIDKLTSGKSDFVTMELTEQTISVNKKVSIVRHKLNAQTNDNGKPGEVHLLVMLVWQKVHGSWKLLARQAVKLN
jgi:hypothetical protein